MESIKLTIKENLSVEIYNFDKETSIESNLIECVEHYYKNTQIKIRFIERPEKFSDTFVGDTHIKMINLLDPDIPDKIKLEYQNNFFEAQICVPFRARGKHAFRKEQLSRFIKHIQNYMKTIHPSIRYRIVIIEQDNNEPFNRGFLLNIGFVECEKRTNCYIKYYIHHNCDLFPVGLFFETSLRGSDPHPNDEPVFLDYSYPGPGVRDHFGYTCGLGGICIINRNAFKLINGFPNNCLCWSTEDEIIKQRCERFNIKINRDKNYNKGTKEENHVRDSSFQKLNQINTRDDNINSKRNGISSMLYKCKIKEDFEFKMENVNVIHYLVDFRI
jgi:hypothetical protein